MDSTPAEVVFSLCADPDKTGDRRVGVFRYSNGPVKVPGPWKRGRPRGRATKNGPKQDGGEETESVPPRFQFVNISMQSTHIDEISRATIRKHAKLNQSRQRRRPYKSIANHREIQQKDPTDAKDQSLMVAPKINLAQIFDVDPFNTSPVKLQPYMHDFLLYYSTTTWKYVYSLETLAGINPVSEYWIPLAFQDAALLHSLIGCAAVYISGYTSVRDGLKGLVHLQTAISIVNERLKTRQNVMFRGIIPVIACIAILEKGSGRHENWQIHMKGLKRLVDIYGGIESLYSNPLFLNKIYRADLYGSLDTGQVPYFNKPCQFLSVLPPRGTFRSAGFNNIDKSINLGTPLRSCIYQLEDALPFWTNNDGSSLYLTGAPGESNKAQKAKPSPAEAARVRDLLTDVQYTLLRAKFEAKSDDDWDNRILEFCRITLIMFSLTILDERGPSSSVGLKISDIIRGILNDMISQSQYTAHRLISASSLPLPVDFILWAIFLAASVMATTESGSDTQGWLLKLFAEISTSIWGDDIHDWHDLKPPLSQYLWVSSIHDTTYHWLWCEVSKVRRTAGFT